MKCYRVQQKLIDYTEKLLDEQEQVRIAEHLQICPDCTHDLQEIEQTVKLLYASPLPEPPEEFWTGFTSKVMREIRKAKAPSRFANILYVPQFRWAMAAAILIVILGGGYVVFNTQIRQMLFPVKITAERPELVDVNQEDAIETALQRIAPEDLQKHILESGDFALFEGATSLTMDADYSEEMVYFLINSLTAEEKEALLSELHKMREKAQ